MSSNPFRKPRAQMCMTPLLEEADRLFPVDLPILSPRSSPSGTLVSSEPPQPAEPPTLPESPETSGPSPTPSL